MLEALNGQIFEMTVELEKVQKQVASLSASRNDTILSADKIVWDKKVEADNIIVAAQAQADQIIAEAQDIRDKAAEEREILNKRSAEIHAQAQAIPDGIATLEKDRKDFEDEKVKARADIKAEQDAFFSKNQAVDTRMGEANSLKESFLAREKELSGKIAEYTALIETNAQKNSELTTREVKVGDRESKVSEREQKAADAEATNKLAAEGIEKAKIDLSGREVAANNLQAENNIRKEALDAKEIDLNSKSDALKLGQKQLKEEQDAVKDKAKVNALKEKDIDDKIRTLEKLRGQPEK